MALQMGHSCLKLVLLPTQPPLSYNSYKRYKHLQTATTIPMRSILVFFILLTPFALFAGEVDDQIARLANEDFEVREGAHRTLLELISIKGEAAEDTKAETIEEKVLAAYKDPKADPESRVRLLNLLKHLVRGTSFESKNGFIGIAIGPSAVMVKGDRMSSVQVLNVMPGLQGHKAGLQMRDQIYKIDDKPFETGSVSDEFMKRIGYKAAGKKVKLHIQRGAKLVEIEVELMKRPGDLAPGVYDEEDDFKESFSDWMRENGLRP